jgi:hypothetical protein
MSRRQRGKIQGRQVSKGLGEEAQVTPRRPSYRSRDEGRDSEADGSFAGEVEGVGFRHASVLTAEGSSHRISQSRMEDTQVVRLKTGGVWKSS